MKIECILRRDGGTHAEIGVVKYHFAPQPDGAHVADVKDNGHIQRFLSLSEGYRIYGTAEAPEAGEPPEEIEGDLDGDGDVDASDERLALVAEYEAKFGRKPHHKASNATIRQKLAE